MSSIIISAMCYISLVTLINIFFRENVATLKYALKMVIVFLAIILTLYFLG